MTDPQAVPTDLTTDLRPTRSMPGAPAPEGFGGPGAADTRSIGEREPDWAPGLAISAAGSDRTPPAADADGPAGPPAVPGFAVTGVLGRGGMGVVYQATHLALQRPVALKMVLAGAHSSLEDRGRFLAEARAVAALQHPNVVQVFEVGDHAGLPYFALEFLPGGNLAQRWHAHPPTPRAAADLVRTLAGAVHAAHQQGIVHRDLKPANVLLAADGTPKITDFGLAKRLDAAEGLTLSGQIIGTPAYMAPEQAEGKSKAVGPAADVYALGVILYEGLTGRPPFAGLTPMDTVFQVLTADVVPPGRLRADLPRDLEVIALKCLEKEPGRRYASAQALADDLGRFLAGRPILARPVGRRERAWRWCHRNPVVAGLAAGLAGLFLTAFGAVTWLYLEADAARARAETAEEAQRQEAQAARTAEQSERRARAGELVRLRRADALAQLLQAVFRGMDPALTPEELTAQLRQRLQTLAARIDRDFPDDPGARGRLRDSLAATLLAAGDARQAVGLFQRALAELTEDAGETSPVALAALANLSLAYYAAGQYPEAQRAAEAAVAGLEAADPGDPNLAAARFNLARALLAQGQRAQALPRFERVVRDQEAAFGADHPDTLKMQLGLAAAYKDAGRWADFLKLSEPLLGQARQVWGETHPDTLRHQSTLAVAYNTQGRPKEALPLLVQVLAARQETLGRDHPETLTAANNLADVYRTLGRFADAVPLLERVVTVRQTRLGADHPDTLVGQANLAEAYLPVGRLAEALKLFEAVVPAARQKLGAGHPTTLAATAGLAGAYRALGRAAEALPVLEGVYRATRDGMGAAHPRTLNLMNDLGETHLQAGQPREAVPWFEQALAGRKATLGADHPQTLIAMQALAKGYLAAQRPAEAVALLGQALPPTRAKFGADHPGTMIVQMTLARGLEAVGQGAKARTLLEATLQVQRAKLGPEHPNTLQTLGQLADLLLTLGYPGEAEALLEATADQIRAQAGPFHPEAAKLLALLASTFERTGQPERAGPVWAELAAAGRQPAGAAPEGRAGWQAQLGRYLLLRGRPAEAEPVLRASLAVRAQRLPRGSWQTANTQSLLGAALLGQGKWAEAEPLLVQGWEGLRDQREALPLPARPNVAAALARLVVGYERAGQTEAAGKYRRDLAAWLAAELVREPVWPVLWGRPLR